LVDIIVSFRRPPVSTTMPSARLAAWTRHLGKVTDEPLLEAVIDSAESAALWVADPNPRAQAFYRCFLDKRIAGWKHSCSTPT
jgi:hypothetical protein